MLPADLKHSHAQTAFSGLGLLIYIYISNWVIDNVVGRDLQEFKLIERYFVNTGGLTGIPASWTLQIFRIERFGDEERWNSAGWNKMAKDEDGRYLLWYGTPLDNMGTILKEGLKNEFERGGIFFSDTAETR